CPSLFFKPVAGLGWSVCRATESKSAHRLVVQHHGEKHRAFPMFRVPANRIIVDPLRDGWIIRVRFSSRDSPPTDPLVFLHEEESLSVHRPALWRQQTIVGRVKSALTAGDQVVVAERGGDFHIETLLSRG